MKVIIEIDCSGSAFEDNPYELSYILGQMMRSDWRDFKDNDGILRDSNGNKVGYVRGE